MEDSKLISGIAEVLKDKKAQDLKVLDLRQVSDSIDYFVIASGGSAPHLKALQNAIGRMLKDQKIRGVRQAGDSESGWIVMDCNNIMVHLFTDETRAYYDLESLWKDAVILEV